MLSVGRELVYRECDGAVSGERGHCSMQVTCGHGGRRARVMGGQSMGVLQFQYVSVGYQVFRKQSRGGRNAGSAS